MKVSPRILLPVLTLAALIATVLILTNRSEPSEFVDGLPSSLEKSELSYQVSNFRNKNQAKTSFATSTSETLLSNKTQNIQRVLAEMTTAYQHPSFKIGLTPVNSDLGVDFGKENIPALAAFSKYLESEMAKPEAQRFADVKKGVELAEARKAALEELITSDPQAAVRSAIPVEMRDQLPAKITAASENFVEGTADYNVRHVCAGNVPGANSRVLTTVDFGGARFSSNTYGIRASSGSNDEMPIHGIAVGENLAISHSPARVISDNPANGAVAVQFGSKTIELASNEQFSNLLRRQLQFEQTPGVTGDATTTSERRLRVARSAVTEGSKNWLVIRVDFSDMPGTPEVGNFYADAGQSMTVNYLKNQTNNVIGPHFSEISFGKYTVATMPDADVTPVYRMPDRIAQYVNRDIWDDLAEDAKNAADNDGYNLNDYDVYYIVSSEHGGEFSGIATFGANDYAIGNGTYDIATTVHEVGHNLNLDHGNLWKPSSSSAPAAGGVTVEYGDAFNIMGSDNTYWGIPEEALHLAPSQMYQIDWLTDDSVVNINQAGSHRIYRYDSETADENRTMVLKIPRSSGKDYWIAYRYDLDGIGGGVGDMSDGAYVTVSGYGRYSGNSNLIDLGANPRDSEGDMTDASLNVGDSYNDPVADVTITVTGKGGSGDNAFIDVDITVPAVPVVDPIVPPATGVSGDVSFTVTATEGPTRFAIGGLPSGLKYDKTTGEIYGKPSVSGTYNIRVYAYNSVGRSQLQEFELVVQPMAQDQIGIFEALVDADPDMNLDLGGRLIIKSAKNGVVTGTLLFGNETMRFRSRFDMIPGGSGSLTKTLRRRDRSYIDLNITVNITGGLSGNVEEQGGGNSTNFGGSKFLFHSRNNPATDYVGRFNSALDLAGSEVGNDAIPQGTGYLIIIPSKTGVAKYVGFAGDGIKFSGSGRLLDNGGGGTVDVPIFARPARAVVSLLGRPTIDMGDDSVSGSINWRKRPVTSARARNYKDGFDPISLTVTGGKYVRPLAGEIVMQLHDLDDNALITFEEGGVENTTVFSELDQILTVATNHRVSYVDGAGPVNPGRVRLAINAKAGVYSGSFRVVEPNPFSPTKNLRRVAKFRGIIIPRETEARGYFRLAELGDPTSDPVVSNSRSKILSGKVTLSQN